MFGKIIITLIAVIAAALFMKRFKPGQSTRPVIPKPPPGSDGQMAKLRKDPKTGEYVPHDD